jgi:DNA-damage-inducible protein J
MPKGGYINVRLENDVKKEAEVIFRKLGLSPSDAVRLFYRQVSLHRGIPFDVRLPNRETRAALRELENPKKRAALPSYASVDELMEALSPKRAAKKRAKKAT